ncbi:hypothetical protein GCM10009759_42700 [Kitasatospora saccharophila]|uniref:Peptide zinc metalloprotease protein n=1 Tax=Kitasatospora saccharophila TaxID=407973 RepID=A0ABP5IRV1_9ACTN
MSTAQVAAAVTGRGHDDILDLVMRPDLDFVADADGSRVIVVDPVRGRQLRMAGGAADLLRSLDGTRTTSSLMDDLGVDDPGPVDRALARFAELELTTTKAGAAAPAEPRKVRRWGYRPPAVLELTLLDPARLLAWCAPVGRALASRPGTVLSTALTVGGLAHFALAGSAAWAELGRPASVTTVLALMLTMVATTFVHELGHGLSLVRGGGRVHRLGVMLMYGSPAMFCDVSEAWRLPRRERLMVALAGIRVHLAVAGAAGLAAPLLEPGGARQLAAGVLVSNLLMAGLNLCPFVKFDGYLALIGWLDRPNLRVQTMAEAGRVAALTVFGGLRGERPSPGRVLFGVACALTGPALAVSAFLNYQAFVLVTLGQVGGALVLALLGWVAFVAVRRTVRWSRTAEEQGAGAVRRAVGALALAGVLAAVLLGVRVPLTWTSVYATTPQGPVLVLPTDLGTDRLDGRTVDLQAAGLVLHPAAGRATVCGGVEDREVTAQAGSPIAVGIDTQVTRAVVPLCPDGPLDRTDGLASFRTGDVPLGSWLVDVFVLPAWSRLF